MTKALTVEMCKELYNEYNTPHKVILHCEEVARVAKALGETLNGEGFNFDIDLIYRAGLLHDLVRAMPEHGIACADILDEKGYFEEADIIRVHMDYYFNDFHSLTETDMVCMGDRLVKENQYVGLDERIQYLIDKTPEPDHQRRILQNKELTAKLIKKIEIATQKTMDGICQR